MVARRRGRKDKVAPQEQQTEKKQTMKKLARAKKERVQPTGQDRGFALPQLRTAGYRYGWAWLLGQRAACRAAFAPSCSPDSTTPQQNYIHLDIDTHPAYLPYPASHRGIRCRVHASV